MKILYIHGLSSSGCSGTSARLRRLLPKDRVYSPDLPVEPEVALEGLRELVRGEGIELIIGTSMGAMFAQKFRGDRKILVNPSFHVSSSMRKRLGRNPFYSERADGATEYEITAELCDRYEEMERGQFDRLSPEEAEITIGLFGTEDGVVDCKEEYLRYYTQYNTFEGGHRLDEESVRNHLLPLIEKLRRRN